MSLPISIRDDVGASAFDLRTRLEQTTVENVVIEAIENIKAQAIFEPQDLVTRCCMEAALRDMLCHLLTMRVVHTVTAAVFTDYSIRSLPKGAARVTFTGRRLIGSGTLTYQKDFQFEGRLLPVWAKQQIRDGIGMVSLSHYAKLYSSDIIFRMF